MPVRHRSTFAAAVFVSGALAACSLVSSPDDLSGREETGGAGRGGDAGRSGGAGELAVGGAGAGGTSGNAGAAGQAAGAAGQAAGAAGQAAGGAGQSAGAAGTVAQGGGGQPAGGAAGANDAGGAGNAGQAGAAGASPGGAAGAAGAPGGSAGAAGQANVPTGALVMGGVVGAGATAEDVLVVLDPDTGKERSREKMRVAAIAHDPGGSGDRWFIFESEGFAEPTPTDVVNLHVRTLDQATGTWTQVTKLQVPSLVIGSVVVLNNRLAYLGYVPGSPAQRRLVVLNTTPGAYGEIAIDEMDNSYDTAGASGLVGIRGTSAPGGTLDVIGVTAAPCAGGGVGTAGFCDVSLRPITVDAAGVTTFAAKKALSFPYFAGAQATWAASASNNEVYVAFPAADGEKPFLRRFSPAGVTALGQPVPFDATGRTFRSMSFDECNGLAFLTELNADQAVFAIPAKKVAPAGVQSLGKPGQRVLYEPTSHSVIVPFSQGGTSSLRAFTVDASESPPTITERSAATWMPPTDIAPGPIAARASVAGVCP